MGTWAKHFANYIGLTTHGTISPSATVLSALAAVVLSFGARGTSIPIPPTSFVAAAAVLGPCRRGSFRRPFSSGLFLVGFLKTLPTTAFLPLGGCDLLIPATLMLPRLVLGLLGVHQ